MDIKALSDILLNIFYVMVGLMMTLTMIYTLKDKKHKTRYGTAAFWGILAVIFIFGQFIPAEVVGGLIIVIAVLSGFNQVNMGTIKQLDNTFSRIKAEKIGLKIFLPSLVIAFVALAIAQFTPISGVAAIGISAVAALILTLIITKCSVSEVVEDSDRMLQSVSSTAILPQLLAALGALFTAAGVGDIISNMISNVILAWYYSLLCRYGIIYSNNGKCFCSIFSNNSWYRCSFCIYARWRSNSSFSSCNDSRILWYINDSYGSKL